MGYVLPIPQYQYSHYRERVLNESSRGDTYIGPAAKVSFDKILRDRAEPQMSVEERRKKRQHEHEAFRVHLAQISRKGFEIDKLA
ncbi:hypothetical protein [Domibacillus aminovorans]|uniref:Uncharacterized protein n=1 Tax=Domibacillus aminovorans TaxID=29332 RepID=A0A177LD73_9BACI|nr:hypothetical protein [Domibacillus aminovorans]OAH63287.1 hypothetical protein AWH49_00070 [Domibacillus aminovorans]